MNEHSSYEISKRLHDKGFRTEHDRAYVLRDMKGIVFTAIDKHHFSDVDIVSSYTFIELWAYMDETTRGSFLVHLTYRVDRNDLADVAGEWLLDNGHIKSEVT